MLAANKGFVDIVDIIIKRGASIDAKVSKYSISLIQLLLKHLFRVNFKCEFSVRYRDPEQLNFPCCKLITAKCRTKMTSSHANMIYSETTIHVMRVAVTLRFGYCDRHQANLGFFQNVGIETNEVIPRCMHLEAILLRTSKMVMTANKFSNKFRSIRPKKM